MNSIHRWFVSLPLALALAGCGSPPDRSSEAIGFKNGDRCTVYFRRDALGMAAELPSSLTTDNHNGAALSLSGSFVSQNAAWLVVSEEAVTVGQPSTVREHTISKGAILMVSKPPQQKDD
jgi:hypothetical protein